MQIRSEQQNVVINYFVLANVCLISKSSTTIVPAVKASIPAIGALADRVNLSSLAAIQKLLPRPFARPAGLETPMPLYFFDIHDGGNMIDDDGTECADLAEAQREAVKVATEVLGVSGHDLWSGETWIMKVREGSKVVAELSFTARKMADAVAALPEAV